MSVYEQFMHVRQISTGIGRKTYLSHFYFRFTGKWWLSRVVDLDCSLAKMHFQSDNRYEWIYRGSTRLSPLYESEKRNAARVEQKGAIHPSRILPRTNREVEDLYFVLELLLYLLLL